LILLSAPLWIEGAAWPFFALIAVIKEPVCASYICLGTNPRFG
jgi:hypothetical protein